MFLPGESHGQRAAGYSPLGHKESDVSEHWSLDSQAHRICPIIINISFATNKSLVQWGGTTEEKTRLNLEFCLK